MNATDVKVNDIEAVIARHPGVRGLRQLRQTLDLVDGGAESPYESLTRLLLVQAGFPRPQTQIPVLDEYGFVIARIDWGHLPLAGEGWPQWRVGVDFEGALGAPPACGGQWTDPKQRSWDVAAVFGIPDDEMGQSVKGVVQTVDPADDAETFGQELLAWLRERLAHYKCPRSISFETQLPRNDTGKLYKQELIEKYS